MKITKIETHVCHARMRNWIFVKVITDDQGLYGWGEATLEWHTRSVVGAIEASCRSATADRPEVPPAVDRSMVTVAPPTGEPLMSLTVTV